MATEQPGLRPGAGSLPWPRVAARLGLSASPALVAPSPLSTGMADLGRPARPTQLTSLSVLADVYFPASRRFRATGGVLLGSRAQPWAGPGLLGAPSGAALMVGRRVSLIADDPAGETTDTSGTVPYLGLGYSDSAADGGWGFSADVGLLALTPRSAVRLGRVLSGQQNFDDMLRELRLTPSVQIGVSYSF